MSHPPVLLTSNEARLRLGLRRSTFHRRVLAGDIQHQRKLPGTGGYLFDATYIDSLAAEQAAVAVA